MPATAEAAPAAMPRVTDILGRDGLIEPSPETPADAPVGDLTREPLSFPADRDLRLQNLARADEGFLLALGYSSQRGYGLAFGQSERKTMSMALVDRSLRARELGEEVLAPAQDEEFVMSHSDNVQATGFVEHLKLPHYVDFQSELNLLRGLRADFDKACATAPAEPEPAT